MKMKYKILAISLVGILSFEVIAPSFSNTKNYGIEQLSNLTTKVKADDLNIEVPESLQEVAMDPNEEINLRNMNAEELKAFEQLAQEEAEKADLPTTEDTEAYKQTLLDLFDSNSSIYQDIAGATDQVIEEINDNHASPLDKITGKKVLAAKHGTISVKFAGSTFNLIISLMAGGGASVAIRTLVRRYGVAKATTMVTRKIAQQVTMWGLKQVTGLSAIVGFVVKTAVDPGTYIARQIDARDKIKNNGWLELW
ncbi:hypothetical protein [Lactococcus petauri]|uniref:hypothetical protein n=1 Tax=Lactococcus petauri TaxID=1940789 RepID=UPI003853B59B